MFDYRKRLVAERYGLAVLVSLVAAFLTAFIRPFLGSNLFLLFFVAVLLSGWSGGFGPALLSTLIAVAAVVALFNPPLESLAILSRLGLFLLASLAVGGLAAARQRAKETATKERDFISAVLDTTSSLIVVLDPRGRVVSCNRAFERLTGYSFHEVRGKPFWELFAAPEGEAASQALESLAGHGFASEFVNHWIGPDGSARPIAWTARPLLARDGTVEQIVATGTELSERERAEADRARFGREQVASGETGRAADQLRRLRAITDTALAHLSLDDLLRELLKRIHEILEVDTGAIFLVEPDAGVLIGRAAIGLEEGNRQVVRLPLDRGIPGRVIAERGPVIFENVDPSDIVSPILREKGVRSLLGAPLFVEGRVIGMIRVGTLRAHRFTLDDAQLLQLVADRVALAIDHAALYEAERAARDEAEAAQQRLGFLAEASGLLAASLDYESTLQTVSRLAVPALADLCIVDVLEEDRTLREVAIASTHPAKAALVRELRGCYRGGINPSHPLWEAIQAGKAVLYPGLPGAPLSVVAADENHLRAFHALGFCSLMVLPLLARGQVLGTITFISLESGRVYGSVELSLAEELARRASLAIDNGRLYRQAQDQTARLRALHEANLTLTSELALEMVLQRIVDLSRELTDARYGALGVIGPDGKLEQFITSGIDPHTRARIGHLPVGLGLLGYLMHKGEPIRVDDIQAHPESVGFPPNHPPMKTLLGIPLFYKGELLGDLYLTEKAGGRPFDESDEELLVLFGAQAAAALANARLVNQIEGLAVVEERQRFAMDLHDGIIQSIYAIGLTLESIAHQVDIEPEVAPEQLRTTIQGLNEVIQDIRRYIANLGPGRFGGKALSAGLADLARETRMRGNTQVTVQVEEGVDESLSPAQKTELFHITREALTNVVKHARATRAEVCVEMDDDLEHAILIIRDNGAGFVLPPDGFPEHHRGLRNIYQRLTAMDGRLEVQTAPGQGTTLRMIIPALAETPVLPEYMLAPQSR